MMISEIKKWAKSHNYEVKNNKEDGSYKWRLLSENDYRLSKDVDTLAVDIFNHLTDNKWKPYQEEFLQKTLEDEKFFA